MAELELSAEEEEKLAKEIAESVYMSDLPEGAKLTIKWRGKIIAEKVGDEPIRKLE